MERRYAGGGGREKTLQTWRLAAALLRTGGTQVHRVLRIAASIEALKQVFGEKYAIMVRPCVVQGLLYLPSLMLSPQKNPLMPKVMISAL
tara:strand:- start:3166 stop:3435 length:270 start_codon:yes stop_codon:yes gene_type:complete